MAGLNQFHAHILFFKSTCSLLNINIVCPCGHYVGQSTATAEQSSGVSTKQILGYLWTPAMVKKHNKDVEKKKKTSVMHHGKTVRGYVLDEWVVGVSTCPSKCFF